MDWSRAKANRVLPKECTGLSKHSLPTTQEKTLHMYVTRWSNLKLNWLYFLQQKMEKLYTVSKNKTRSWCGSDHELLIDEFRLKLKKVGKTTRPFRSVQFSSLSCVWLLWPHGLQYSRLPCPSQTPRACSNSCPLSQWCHLNIASSVIPFSYSLIIPSIRVFSNESVLHIRWSKYWSFSFSTSPSNEYSGTT